MPDGDKTSDRVFSRPLGVNATSATRDGDCSWVGGGYSQLRVDTLTIGKRAADIVISLFALLFFGPLMITIALAIKVFDPGPIFFAQPRIGLRGETFNCLKFRTMVFDADKRLRRLLEVDAAARREWCQRQKLSRDPRVTPLGCFLRLSSLDELPQFLNVLRGDMSIVGPRPIIDDERKRYGRYLSHYCRVKPGLTGLWQVTGRNNTSYRRRVAIDVYYTRNRSAKLDLWVMFKTPKAVFERDGVY